MTLITHEQVPYLDVLMDTCSATVSVQLRVVEVMWRVDLYNVSCIDLGMRSVMCYGYFEKRFILPSVNSIFLYK
jgi:hypothetical protein